MSYRISKDPKLSIFVVFKHVNTISVRYTFLYSAQLTPKTHDLP